jgi:hypothetical protein
MTCKNLSLLLDANGVVILPEDVFTVIANDRAGQRDDGFAILAAQGYSFDEDVLAAFEEVCAKYWKYWVEIGSIPGVPGTKYVTAPAPEYGAGRAYFHTPLTEVERKHVIRVHIPLNGQVQRENLVALLAMERTKPDMNDLAEMLGEVMDDAAEHWVKRFETCDTPKKVKAVWKALRETTVSVQPCARCKILVETKMYRIEGLVKKHGSERNRPGDRLCRPCLDIEKKHGVGTFGATMAESMRAKGRPTPGKPVTFTEKQYQQNLTQAKAAGFKEGAAKTKAGIPALIDKALANHVATASPEDVGSPQQRPAPEGKRRKAPVTPTPAKDPLAEARAEAQAKADAQADALRPSNNAVVDEDATKVGEGAEPEAEAEEVKVQDDAPAPEVVVAPEADVQVEDDVETADEVQQ